MHPLNGNVLRGSDLDSPARELTRNERRLARKQARKAPARAVDTGDELLQGLEGLETMLERFEQAQREAIDNLTPMVVDYDTDYFPKDFAPPAYSTEGAACFDLQANVEGEIILQPGRSVCIDTGLKIAIPAGWKLDICSRSGLALKHQVFVLNAPGIIDADYRGVVGVILYNAGSEAFSINRGDRIAQGSFNKIYRFGWNPKASLDATERGESGFGSTGVATDPTTATGAAESNLEAQTVPPEAQPYLTEEEYPTTAPEA